MCTWICAGSAPSVEPAEAALSATLLDRSARAKTDHHPVLLTLHEHRQQQQAHRTTHRRRLIVRSALVAPKTLRRCAPQSELPDGITDLALSGRVPSNGSSATHRVALCKAARPPGQATARGPLQCRVGPPVQLPLVQIRVNRTIKNYYFAALLSPHCLGG